jgi:hypothetical protein
MWRILRVAISCWCNAPGIVFHEDLLQQVPAALQEKACICKSCVDAFELRGSEPGTTVNFAVLLPDCENLPGQGRGPY